MRIVFLGTSSFACPALRSLYAIHEIALVITQPDRPAGRRRELRPPAVKVMAYELGLPVAQPERISSPAGVHLLQEAHPGAIVVASYGQLLKREVFSLPPRGTINIHASLLPRYRGAAPINWAIINGEQETGITTFLIDAGMDTGAILQQRKISIGPDETAGELHDRLAALGAEVIIDTLHGIEEGTIALTTQDDALASRAPKLCREDGRINWVAPAQKVHNWVRGMNPWPGAFTTLCDRRIKVYRTRLTGISRRNHSPGEITLRETGRLLVATNDELIELLAVQRAGRPRTSGREFLNGLRGEARFN